MEQKVFVVLENLTLRQKFYFQAVVLPEIENVLAKYSEDLKELGEEE